jgi:hypothetical protein
MATCPLAPSPAKEGEEEERGKSLSVSFRKNPSG